ncbi:MAG: WYL domain-containing protein [Candidatus Dormibacteraeota bacterium]|nr:WYL domain-containing protein [Candidatus Dormibacteraeota bacterium]
MRADRLLSILLLLQAHGRLTASDLAGRLEVSRRTVCRDLDALSGAGVPVVTDRGPSGGAYLIGGYRTDLTGLTEPELEALLAFGGQGPAADLGLGAQLDQASRKLAVAAGPGRASRLRERVLVDGDSWFWSAPASAHLGRVHDAVRSDRRLRLRYRRGLDRVVDRVLEPYGLVCKAGTWYLLAGVGGQPRVYRVSRIEDAELTEETFKRPVDFDLRRVWAAQIGQFKSGVRERMSVTVRVDPAVSGQFTRLLGESITDRPGEGLAVLDFPACDTAVGLLVAFGDAIEVIDPPIMRKRLAAIGSQLAALYGKKPRPSVSLVK